ncbi:MAG: DUF2240 family protein [Candidatus Methanomethylophilaceae archaeon]|nr:DUF2240 family protein [Candidatus Methanomethylophilaceae archaeon]
MEDEIKVCVAAFFRSIGKDATTTDEFVMSSSLEMKWMAPSDAKRLVSYLRENGAMEERNGFLRPTFDVYSVDLPITYKPSAELVSKLGKAPAPVAKRQEAPKEAAPKSMFETLMSVAVSNGMKPPEFVQGSNKINRKLGIDASVASLIVLRDAGVDITPYVDAVRNEILGVNPS